MSFSSFWKNPENNSLKTLVVVGAVGVAGVFAFTFAHINPFTLTGRLFDSLFGYGYGTSIVPPTVATYPPVLSPTLVLQGAIGSTGGATVTARGFTYTLGTSVTTLDTGAFGLGPYNKMIFPDPAPGCYTVQAWASNSAGTGYGATIPFMWHVSSCGTTTTTTSPVVTTDNSSAVTSTSATLQGSITATGGANATRRGFTFAKAAAFNPGCMSTSGYSLTGGMPCSSNMLVDQTGSFSTGSFTLPTAGAGALVCNQSYRFQAFAVNPATPTGSNFGAVLTFTTAPCTTATPPTVTTVGITLPTTTNVILNGTLNTMGTGTPATPGFTYGTAVSGVYTTPVTTTMVPASITTAGTPFKTTLSGLTCGTSYKFIAKATTSAGTGTGSPVAFNTSPCATTVVLPTVSPAYSGYGSNYVIWHSSVSNLGGAPSVTVGFQYGLNSIPFTSPSITTITAIPSSLTTLTNFDSSNITTGILCNTAYHVRGFATNSAGTAYGAPQTITTFPCPSTITTTAFPSSVTSTTATVKGNISAWNGWTIPTVGFDYSTAPITTTSYGTRVITGPRTALGAYSQNLTGLTPHTTYYFRTWGRNSMMTDYTYGAVYTFVTP